MYPAYLYLNIFLVTRSLQNPSKGKFFCFVSDEVGHQGYLFIFETDVNSGGMNP